MNSSMAELRPTSRSRPVSWGLPAASDAGARQESLAGRLTCGPRACWLRTCWLSICWLACCTFLGGAALGQRGGDREAVTFRLLSDRTYVGQPVVLEVQVRSDGSVEAPEAPVVRGAEVSASTPSRAEFTEIINGRVSRSLTVTHRFSITPTAPGSIVVPPISITVGGVRYSSDPQTITVLPLASDDRLLADIVVEPASTAWVGQGVDVTLRLWIKRYTDPRWNVTVPADSMWSFLDDGSRWGIFESTVRTFAQARNRPPHKVMRRDTPDGESATYDVFEIVRRIYPGRPGPLDIGQVSIRMQYPMRLERGSDLFDRGSLRVSQSVPLVAVPQAPVLEVKPLPEAGRPPTFAGAVGRFEIEAAAKPTDAAVGDPIDLTLVIKDRTVGGADLATLSPPRLAEQPDLAAEFRISSDPVAGSVQGWMKTFTVVIRPLREGISAIPPVVLAYFDPIEGAYREARSQAIPVKVRRGVSLDVSRIVDARGDVAQASVRPLGEGNPGIMANETDFDRLLRKRTLALTPTIVGAAVAPPILFVAAAATMLLRRRAERHAPMQRRLGARRRAERALRRAHDPGEVRSSLIECIADLTDRPRGTLTADEAVSLARRMGAGDSESRRLAEVLGACELLAFAPTAGESGGPAERLDSLRTRAFEALRSLPSPSPRASTDREVVS